MLEWWWWWSNRRKLFCLRAFYFSTKTLRSTLPLFVFIISPSCFTSERLLDNTKHTFSHFLVFVLRVLTITKQIAICFCCCCVVIYIHIYVYIDKSDNVNNSHTSYPHILSICEIIYWETLQVLNRRSVPEVAPSIHHGLALLTGRTPGSPYVLYFIVFIWGALLNEQHHQQNIHCFVLLML